MGWEKVEGALLGAKALAFDGCHKIYLAMDEAQVASFREYGYEQEPGQMVVIEPPVHVESALAILNQWWDASCGLRFVQAVTTTPIDPVGDFTNLIGQFELDEEDEDSAEEHSIYLLERGDDDGNQY